MLHITADSTGIFSLLFASCAFVDISPALLVQSRSRCINPLNVQFSCYIINVFIIDKMPRVFPLEEIIPICT